MAKTDDTAPEEIARPAKRPRWRGLFRLFGCILAALILSPVALEGGLRACGYGHSTHAFLKKHAGGKTFYVYNKWVFRRFLNNLEPGTWDLTEFNVMTPKPEKTIRILAFGGGQSCGWPDPAFSEWRFLEAMLETCYPGVTFEFYNASYPFMNSNIARQIALDCAPLQLDLFISYMGGNEFMGPFGPIPSNNYKPPAPTLGLIRANMWLSNFRVYQLAGDKGPLWWFKDWIEPPTLNFRPDDPEVPVVYGVFERNLEDVCDAVTRAGGRVILCTEGCNQRDWAPVGPNHRRDLSETALVQWDQLFTRGVEAEKAGNYEAAISEFNKAAALDDFHSELHFHLARCYWNTQQYEPAKEHYAQALEHDQFTWARAKKRSNEIITGVAGRMAAKGVFLADSAKRLAEHSPHGIPGCEFFVDQVHLSFDGAYEVARAAFDQAAQALKDKLPPPVSTEPPSADACKQRLGITPALFLQDLRFTPANYRARAEEPPAAVLQQIADLEKQVGLDGSKQIDEALHKAVDAAPTDFYLLVKNLSFSFGAEAAKQAETLIGAYPYRRLAWREYARALIGNNKPEEAIRTFGDILALYPDDVDSYLQWGAILESQDKTKEALALYRKATAEEPDSDTAWCRQAQTFLKLGRNKEAMYGYRQAILANRFVDQPYQTLDGLLAAQGDKQARIREWRTISLAVTDMYRPFFYLGIALDENGELDAATEAYNKALLLSPTNEQVQARLNSVKSRIRGNLEAAIDGFRQAIEGNPHFFQPYLDMENYLEKNFELDRQIEEWRQIAAAHADTARPFFYLGNALQNKKDYGGATEAFRKAVNLEPNDPAFLSSMGQCMFFKGDFQGAIEPLRHALEINPSILIAHEQLFKALCETGQYAAAREEAEQCKKHGVAVPPDLEEKIKAPQ